MSSFDVKVNIPSTGSTDFGVNFSNAVDMIIDWGDSSTNTVNGSITQSHTYTAAGVYTVKISGGTCSRLRFNVNSSYLIELLSAIPDFGITDFSSIFLSCNNITNIPDAISGGTTTGLFDNNTAATNFTGAFNNTSITSIPSALFANNTAATNFSSTFFNTSITSIPSALFANNTAATNFYNTFGNTPITSIPSVLFANNTAVLNFVRTFTNTPITSIPSTLFANNTAVTNFESTFNNTSITSIPSALFTNNTAVTSFYNTFSNTSITSIPSALFANNTAVKRFTFTFYGTPITSIPSALFANNTAVTSFSFTFYGTPITSIPSTLFDNNTAVTGFDNTFSNTSITSIPSALFANNTAAIGFEATFSGCTSLSSVPAGLFSNQPNATTFARTFYGCIKLSLDANIFWTSNKATRFLNKTVFFTETFALQNPFTGAQGTAPDLWNVDFGSGIAYGTNTFAGHTTQSLTNYCEIPVTWGGDPTIPDCNPLQLLITPSADDIFGISFDNPTNISIHWGTGDVSANINTSLTATYTYPIAGVYTVTISGDSCDSFRITENKFNLIEVLTPVPYFNANNFNNTFEYCGSLTAIPGDIFSKNPNVVSFTDTFYDCELLSTVSGSLFSNNTAVSSFIGTFFNCELTSIPSELFENNTNVSIFKDTFSSNAITSIPATLFNENISVTSFEGVFSANFLLKDVPVNLFAPHVNVEKFDNLFISCGLTSIPDGLFDNNPLVKSFNGVFGQNANLSSVPQHLFSMHTQATGFANIFEQCDSLTLNPDIFWGGGGFPKSLRFLNKTVDFDSAFFITSFSGNIGTAPSLWTVDFGTGTAINTQFTFLGHSTQTLDNFCLIPTAWGGDPLSDQCGTSFVISVLISDNNTPFDISFVNASNMNVDWGDGTTTQSIVGTSTLQHIYSTKKNYSIEVLAAPGETVVVDITGALNASIDWGDGTFDLNINGTNTLTKTYTGDAVNEYSVLIESMSFDDILISGTATILSEELIDYAIYRILIYGNTCDNFKFTNNQEKIINILSDIPDFNLQSAESMFESCTSLSIVPSGLFSNNNNITSFKNTFSDCISLNDINESLFSSNVVVTTFEDTFSNCSDLTEIPVNIFSNNAAVTNFNNTFFNTPLTSIPQTLFSNNNLVTSMVGTFSQCNNINTVPVNLFELNANITTFDKIFANCINLSSVPELTFANNTLATSFASSFLNCNNLELNASIFYQSVNEQTRFFNQSVNFTDTFKINGTFTGIRGIAPSIWLANYGSQSPISTDTFAGHSLNSLLNYCQIPTSWGGGEYGCFTLKVEITDISQQVGVSFINANNMNIDWGDGVVTPGLNLDTGSIHTYPYVGIFYMTIYGTSCDRFFMTDDRFVITEIVTTIPNLNIKSFQSTFSNCSILNVPNNLFTLNTAATSFAYTFSECSQLSSIPSNVFDSNTNATTFEGCFYNCTSLQSVNQSLFSNNANATTFEATFSRSGIQSLPNSLFSNNINVTTFKSIFENTPLTTIPYDLFVSNINVTTFENAFKDCTLLENVTNIGPTNSLFNTNTLVTSFRKTFENCVKLSINPYIFYTSAGYSSRFLDKSVNFQDCFRLTQPFTGTQGTAPDLWNINYGTGSVVSERTFAGHSLSSLINYCSIPFLWGGNPLSDQCGGPPEPPPSDYTLILNDSTLFKANSKVISLR